MTHSLVIKIILGLSVVIMIFFFGLKLFEKENKTLTKKEVVEEDIDTTTNVIKDVSYRSKDAKGNEYILMADEGQIDLSNNKIIFLTKVEAKIITVGGEVINIQSDYGKYNINNYDTIFSKKVMIGYEDSKINGNYVDFSLNRNSLIISKNVVYSNQESSLNADVVEINIETKDAKIFMYEKEKKVKIKSN